jgi:hypothetical protein
VQGPVAVVSKQVSVHGEKLLQHLVVFGSKIR